MRCRFKYRLGAAVCPFPECGRTFRTQGELVEHFDRTHSCRNEYEFYIHRWPHDNGYRNFSITGTCGCGCGGKISYPIYPVAGRDWMPAHAPPYYLRGHTPKKAVETVERTDPAPVETAGASTNRKEPGPGGWTGTNGNGLHCPRCGSVALGGRCLNKKCEVTE